MRVTTKTQVAAALLHLDKMIGTASFKQSICARYSVFLVPETTL